MRAGVAAQRAGDNRAAIEDFRKALAIKPGLVEAHAGLGVALAATGQLDAAIDEDTRALAEAPNRADVRMNLGKGYFKKAARKASRRVAPRRPCDIDAQLYLRQIGKRCGSRESVDSNRTRS